MHGSALVLRNCIALLAIYLMYVYNVSTGHQHENISSAANSAADSQPPEVESAVTLSSQSQAKDVVSSTAIQVGLDFFSKLDTHDLLSFAGRCALSEERGKSSKSSDNPSWTGGKNCGR